LDKGKGIDLSNLSEQEQTRRLEKISKELYENRLLRQISGDSEQRFIDRSEEVLTKIETFNGREYFPTESLKTGMRAAILG
jgi:hypothetical protein